MKKIQSNPFILVILMGAIILSTACQQVPETIAESDKYRLVWNTDPTTTVTLAWDQLKESESEVFYGTTDFGRKFWKYKEKATHSASNNKYEMNTRFALLENLQPGTAYYFVVKDDFGVSERYWFKTAPATPEAFTFAAGGDTKSEGLPLEAGRSSNRIVGKIRPLFVLFNGDFTSGSGTDANNWKQWLTDWQEQTTTSDGRMTPIFPVHGNHENGDKGNLHYIFNSPYHENDSSAIYYSLTLGGNFLHLIALNSEIETGSAQKKWLEEDLKASENCTFKIAGFHKPFRPHTTSKRENDKLLAHWAWLFDQYGLNVAIDADSHMHKVTYPIRPDSTSAEAFMGFVRDDEKGTMYIGEGSWGATPRANNDDKPWTLASGSFNQIKWIHVLPESENNKAQLKIYTIITAKYDSLGNQSLFDKDVEALTEDNLFDVPENLNLFTGESFGKFVVYPFEN